MLYPVTEVRRFTGTAARGCYTSRFNPRRVDKVTLFLACGHQVTRNESAGIPKRVRCNRWHSKLEEA